jgi:crossover junction endodeoxyribonuclease RuvC
MRAEAMIRIIGVDPGSRITGYGIVDTDGFRHKYVTSGYIKIKADTLGEKLGIIYAEVSQIVSCWTPESMAIERVFVKHNADSALKLGQARGAAICAAVQTGLVIGEYSPRAIKKAVVGSGAADKQQVQHMIQRLLNLEALPQNDEADALAIAICHAHHIKVRNSGVAAGTRRGRWV